MTDLEKNTKALVSRRVARACAELLGTHLIEENAKKMEFPIGKARVIVETLEGPFRAVRRPRPIRYIEAEVMS